MKSNFHIVWDLGEHHFLFDLSGCLIELHEVLHVQHASIVYARCITHPPVLEAFCRSASSLLNDGGFEGKPHRKTEGHLYRFKKSNPRGGLRGLFCCRLRSQNIDADRNFICWHKLIMICRHARHSRIPALTTTVRAIRCVEELSKLCVECSNRFTNAVRFMYVRSNTLVKPGIGIGIGIGMTHQRQREGQNSLELLVKPPHALPLSDN